MTRGFLIPDLEYRFHARQVTLRARQLHNNQARARVLSLAGGGPFAQALPDNSLVTLSHKNRLLPPAGWLELYHWLKTESLDHLEVWGRSALRAFIAIRKFRRVQLRWTYHPLIGEKISQWDRYCLRGCEAVVISGAGYGEIWHSCQEHAPVLMGEPVTGGHLTPLSLPENARILVSYGQMDRFDSFVQLLWAFDVLRRLEPCLHLVLIGEGLAKNRLIQFENSINPGNTQVHFLPEYEAISHWLSIASAVWIPADPHGGICRTLESLQFTKPVFAPRFRHLELSVPNSPALDWYDDSEPIQLSNGTRRRLLG
ncbi:hypothetical protein KIH39_16665 [Telmatocola sphagniphila]|uniref:Glycosyltransferase n=1 Tax=Telmatocola sphagniphila TaxID=1123043 RepID=A0A8E6B375_9BACT|nr:hypothetical protein [Telmatocola sphagniphila]QVL30482.1 hypothetical protein KIH39_16665 [Telmatocola sphagniphila]